MTIYLPRPAVFSDRSKVQLIILKNKGMDLHRQVLAIIVPSVL